MCGRYTLTDPNRIAAAFPQFRFEEFSEYRLPRYNIAPTQNVLGVRNDGSESVRAFRWGLTGGSINARGETLAERPTFRDAARARRCILFADGFYEWRSRKPFRFTRKDGAPFAMAAIWDPALTGPPSCAIVTCAPNALVAPVHDRMPVMLPGASVDAWLAESELAPDAIGDLLVPFDPGLMEAAAVSSRVNDARYDAPDVLLDDDPVQTTFEF